MTKKTRKILFSIFLFLFLLTAPSSIFYFQGYRFDFKNKKIRQTGGFFLKAEPKQVEIYIDEKLVKKTDFFFGSALVENLLPKKYKIEVKKDGYLSWKKNLEIKEKEVTEVKNLVLFPQSLKFNILSKEVENFWFSPDGKKIILKEIEGPLTSPLVGGWALKLYDLEKNIKSHLISETEVYSKGADLMNLKFSEDPNTVYLNASIKEQEQYFTLRLDKSPPQLSEREITPTAENVIASQKINNDFYYLDNSGNLFKNEMKLTEIPFPVKKETYYDLEIFQDFVFLKEEKTLYLFSPDSKAFEKFFEQMSDLKISPDKKKLVFFSGSEIWVLFLKDEGPKKVGEKLFLVRFSEKIDDVFWLNSDYLIFNSGTHLKIVETDDRDRIQTWDIALRPNFFWETSPEFYFNGSNRKLYILSQGNLFASEKLFSY